MADSAFSEDGKYYSALSQDGRLRIWDTETNVLKQEYTPDLHLTSPPSCLQWISVAQSSGSSQKGGKRKSISICEQEVQCIALGTTSGKILIYSVAQAKIETVLTDDTNSQIQKKKITSIDWNRKYGLFSCNKDNFVYEWDLQTCAVSNKYNLKVESKNKQSNSISAIRIVPHNQSTTAKYLVATSVQIRLWRLHNGVAVVVKSLGHSSSPKGLLTIANLNNKCWLIEGSQTERLLSFWDVTITSDLSPQLNGEDGSPNKKQRKKSISEASIITTPTYNFVLEDAPRILDVKTRSEDGTKLMLAAATRSGVVHYYEQHLNGPSTKPIKPSVTIQVTTADAQPIPLQCCHLPPQGDLLLGYTQGPVLNFERVTPDLKTKTQVLIRGEKTKKQKKNKQANEATKVKSGTSNAVTYVEPMGGVSRKRPSPGAGTPVEIPMEARLANLALDTKERSKSAVNQNLTKLLIQALHSKDKNLTRTVLQNNSIDVAKRTVSNLPAQYVFLLLEELTEMATRKTSQCACVCTWLTALLRCHSALLLASANSKASTQLTSLLAIFTHRRSNLCQLLNLNGRLSLTLAQRQTPDDNMAEQEPVLQYNDTSSDEEMEVERYQSASDAESWDDDKFEGSDGEDEEENGEGSDDASTDRESDG